MAIFRPVLSFELGPAQAPVQNVNAEMHFNMRLPLRLLCFTSERHAFLHLDSALT